MKEFLNKIRVPDENTTMKSKIVNTILIFFPTRCSSDLMMKYGGNTLLEY